MTEANRGGTVPMTAEERVDQRAKDLYLAHWHDCEPDWSGEHEPQKDRWRRVARLTFKLERYAKHDETIARCNQEKGGCDFRGVVQRL